MSVQYFWKWLPKRGAYRAPLLRRELIFSSWPWENLHFGSRSFWLQFGFHCLLYGGDRAPTQLPGLCFHSVPVSLGRTDSEVITYLTLYGWSHSCSMNSAALQVTSLFISTFIFRAQQPVISLLHSLRYLVSTSVRMCTGLTSVCVLGTSIQFFQRGWQVKELWRSVLKVRRSSQELSSTTYFSAGAEYLHFSGFFSFFFFFFYFFFKFHTSSVEFQNKKKRKKRWKDWKNGGKYKKIWSWEKRKKRWQIFQYHMIFCWYLKPCQCFCMKHKNLAVSLVLSPH